MGGGRCRCARRPFPQWQTVRSGAKKCPAVASLTPAATQVYTGGMRDNLKRVTALDELRPGMLVRIDADPCLRPGDTFWGVVCTDGPRHFHSHGPRAGCLCTATLVVHYNAVSVFCLESAFDPSPDFVIWRFASLEGTDEITATRPVGVCT